ncbi:recombinase family protein [Candidatus Acetothermia bacterium]|nr:recombinase family protein [Candidatus Acetothermia bacterium]
MKKAFGYTRVSTEEQAREGLSLPAQVERIRAYCSAQGIRLSKILSDEGVSAAKPLAKRPAGAKLLEAISARDADTVVAIKLDRLFRDAVDCLATVKTWDEQGIALHLLDLGGSAFNSASALGRFFLTVMAGAAEMERNLISERTKGALTYKRSKGEWLGAAPFGHRWENGKLLVDEMEQEIMAAMRCDRKAKHLSVRELADKYRVPKSTVYDILRRPKGIYAALMSG